MKKIFLSIFAIFLMLFSFSKLTFCLAFQDLKNLGLSSENTTDIEKLIKKFMPKSSENMNGSIRIRYQSETAEGTSQTMPRLLFRAGFKTKNPLITAAWGLVTGDGNPRSGNQTLKNTFQSLPINVDYAFIKISPGVAGDFLMGKMNNPLWHPSDLIWDSDITPEGISFNFDLFSGSEFKIFSTAALFVLDNYSSDPDPSLTAFQPGFFIKLTSDLHWRMVGNFYIFKNVSGNSFKYSAKTNSVDNSKLIYNYNSLGGASTLTFRHLLFGKHVTFYGEGIYNTSTRSDNKGALAGIKIGDLTVEENNEWQARISHRLLQKDAWLDTFPDSEAYKGQTGIQGTEIRIEYALARSSTLSLNVYSMHQIANPSNTDLLLQADFLVKF